MFALSTKHGQHQGGPTLDGGGRKRGLRAPQGRSAFPAGIAAQGLVGGAGESSSVSKVTS
ncbi:hypothetical protein TSUKUMMB_23130 [Rhodococcus sp. no. 34]